jgi:hypothetical protein
MRSFTIESVHKPNGTKVNYDGGRFVGPRPSDAVRKMFTKANTSTGSTSLNITLRETTQGSAGKTFKYKVTKVPEEKTVVRNGVEVTFHFTTKVKAMSV